jgi:hypothetical protein
MMDFNVSVARRSRPLILDDHKFDPDPVVSAPCDATLPARPAVLRKEQHEIIRNAFVSGQHQLGAAMRHVEESARYKGSVLAIGDPNPIPCVSSDAGSLLTGHSETILWMA